MSNSQKTVLAALAGQQPAVPPIWLMRQAGRYLPEYRQLRTQAPSFLDFCYTPDLAVEATLQPIRRYNFDAAILFCDILVIPDALGQEVRFVEGEGPKLAPLRRIEEVRRLSAAGVEAHLSPVYDAVGRIRRALPEATTLIGFAGAPWTVACYMVEGGGSRDFLATKKWALSDPDGFQILIDLLVEASIEHLSQQIAAGADVVQLFDSWAGVLPEAAFRRLVIRPTRRIVDALAQRCPGVPVIGFPRGAGVMASAYAAETGISCIGLDSAQPSSWAAAILQGQCAVQGNLDPVYLLAGGEAMVTAARDVVEALGKGPFIFNLGHGVIKETPPEHVSALVAAVREGRP